MSDDDVFFHGTHMPSVGFTPYVRESRVQTPLEKITPLNDEIGSHFECAGSRYTGILESGVDSCLESHHH